ncbi:2-polyprenyl-3-methyl-5-hydroxy-6-metoxy-1,4-benzoquinol methylase [Mycolicibacterium iranicum]|uniref:2-polyprenyl-3-methyl-5-hydroxy-6-metoxy-1, 4-benzoquinol methylase n=1 Tax=Mycolicibacterium iranicum TaxID=912594 RepID=A0A839QBD4_MYCIR|nr:class I SAM-dependent methyltransferase [Mycolicibacterium iranicum]MBB2991765.1 2-polyprenyl-3-methyl-5-hydroxy-6-metoxy-1,4-benzoquinol methylase [Mycolicibacterium iranicum]
MTRPHRRDTPAYWNHNTAYHPWLARIAAEHRGDVLDVGCGDGLLAARLAPLSRSVTGVDCDAAAVERARARVRQIPNVTVTQGTFGEDSDGDARYDLIAFVATIHHMDLRAALGRARDLLRPGGEIAIVGLAANRSPVDWMWSGLCLPAVRIGSLWHRETRDIGVAVATPQHSLADIRRIADEVIPGAHMRRALYYRYLLRWRRP